MIEHYATCENPFILITLTRGGDVNIITKSSLGHPCFTIFKKATVKTVRLLKSGEFLFQKTDLQGVNWP